MTTEEFIKKVNSLSEDERGGVRATLSPTGEPVIETDYTPMHKINPRMLAYLPRYTKSWKFLEDSTIPGCVLKLMAKLASSKYLEKRYVILNGEPMRNNGNIDWCVFTLGNRGQYLVSHNTTVPEILTQCSYTREELEEATKWLPEEWCSVIDNLLTPLDVALEGNKQ